MTPVVALWCARAHDLFADYYGWDGHAPDFAPYLVEGDPDDEGGAVLFQEDPGDDSLFLGIRFGGALLARLDTGTFGRHELAVVAEETSHFMTLLHAATLGARVSQLDLETLGEIDRFLFLLHSAEGLGIPSLCDAVFQGPRFLESEAVGLYVEAEGRAFHHLRRAFWHVWEDTRFDPDRADARAARYLGAHRKALLRPSVAA